MEAKLRIKEMREARGIKTSYLADAVGVSRSTICFWENGSRMPSRHHIVKLAQFFNCSVAELFGIGASNAPENMEELTPKQKRLFETHNKFSEKQQETILEVMEMIAEKSGQGGE